MTESTLAIQDQMSGNNCYGCGPNNDKGLRIKSYWIGDDQSVCHYLPEAHQCAGPPEYLNGGVIATIIDCHCVCTASAKAYQMAGRPIGEGDHIWFATGKLEVSYFAPVPINQEVQLTATVVEAKEKKVVLKCELTVNETLCCSSEVVAVRVPDDWVKTG